jgi:hypothetical protein
VLHVELEGRQFLCIDALCYLGLRHHEAKEIDLGAGLPPPQKRHQKTHESRSLPEFYGRGRCSSVTVTMVDLCPSYAAAAKPPPSTTSRWMSPPPTPPSTAQPRRRERGKEGGILREIPTTHLTADSFRRRRGIPLDLGEKIDTAEDRWLLIPIVRSRKKSDG